MKNDEMLGNEVQICDEKKKGEVKKELEYCADILNCEHKKLYDYQLDYFCWFNTRKDILDSMKSKHLNDECLTNILNFCDERNSFLVEKLKTINSYISYVKKSLSSFESINDFVYVDSIDTNLRLMLTSLGLQVPGDIFGRL